MLIRIFLLAFALAGFSFAAKPATVTDVSMLKYADYKTRMIQRPLLEAALADTTQGPGIRALTQASLFFDDGQYDSAWALYRAHKREIPEIEGQVLMRMARCALQLGHADSARSILFSSTSLVKNRPWWERADRILVDALMQDTALKADAKLDSLETRIQAKPSTDYRAFLRLQQAQLYQGLGQYDKAQAAYVELLRNSDWGISALDGLISLKSHIGFPKATYPLSETTLRLCKTDNHKECVAWADSLLVRPDLEPSRRNLVLAAQAAAWQGLEKLDKAAAIYRWLIDSVEVRPGWLQSLVRLERKLKRTEDANRLDTLFRTEFPYSPENANNIWVKALELEQDSQWVDAFLAYSELKDARFGKSTRHQWAPFRMGYLWFKQGMYQEALQVLEQPAQEDEFAWPQAASLFFRAESFRMLKRDSAARAEYLSTIKAFPLSWYGYRARSQLLEQHLLDSAHIPWVHIIDTNTQGALDWLHNHIGHDKHAEKSAEERVRMVELLFRTGFDEDARSILSKTMNAYSKRLDFLFLVGQMYMRVGEYGEAYHMAREFLDVVDRRWLGEMPRPIAEFLYPLPALWRKDAEHYIKPPVDLYFVFGVMRQESIFVANISSPVGARGLLQIMPQTGRNLAKAEGIHGFHEDLLYNPIMSIRLGSRYLNDLLLDFGGDPVYTLANYNAGPAPAKRWQKETASMPYDARVEEISFWETREYVKKVMGNTWSYRAIYGGH